MNTRQPDYNLFFDFIETYSRVGFKGIDRGDPLILDLEKFAESNDQFFYIGDVVQMQFFFTSNRSLQMLGIQPEVLTPYHFFEATHPDDIQRHTLGRAKLFKLVHDLYVAEKGFTVMSTNYRFRNPSGNFSNLLIQLYLYYSTIPYKSVFVLKVHTNIDWCKKIKHGFHYYIGSDLSYFRYPDDELLQVSIPFSDREFEIIRLIADGLNSEQVAEKLFLSIHTVNTHRRNILEKTGKGHISDLIYYLQERGLL
jgi:DNA-binding CsgD family transcriptional regulator